MGMNWFVSRSNGSRIGSRINEQFATAGPLDLLPSGEEFLHSIAGTQITLAGKIELYKGLPEIVISSPAQIAKE